MDYELFSNHNIDQEISKYSEHISEEFVCPECKFEFSTDENLKIHLKNVHSKAEFSDKNQSAYRELPMPRDLSNTRNEIFERNHQEKSAYIMEGSKLKCNLCPYTASKKSQLKRHVKAVHDKIKDYVCGECGYTASQEINLNSASL